MIVNLTPHVIRIRVDDPSEVPELLTDQVIEPESTPARVCTRREIDWTHPNGVDGIPVYNTIYGEVQGLPDPVEGTTYVVSFPVLAALSVRGIRRPDVVGPDTGPESRAVRKNGQIWAVRSFQS